MHGEFFSGLVNGFAKLDLSAKHTGLWTLPRLFFFLIPLGDKISISFNVPSSR